LSEYSENLPFKLSEYSVNLPGARRIFRKFTLFNFLAGEKDRIFRIFRIFKQLQGSRLYCELSESSEFSENLPNFSANFQNFPTIQFYCRALKTEFSEYSELSDNCRRLPVLAIVRIEWIFR